MRIPTFIFAITIFFFCAPAFALHICWIEEIDRIDDVIRIHLMTQYQYALRNIKRASGEYESPVDKNKASFDLREGEIAFISTSHNSCTATGIKRNGILGVELVASTCMPGLSCTSGTEFISPDSVPIHAYGP